MLKYKLKPIQMKNADSVIDKTLTSFAQIYPQLDFIKSLRRVYQHNDLPNFYAYAAVLSNSKKTTDGHIKDIIRASGISFSSEKLALLKCLGEIVERYSSTTYKNNNLVYKTYKSLGEKAVDPKKFSYFSESQLKTSGYQMFNYDDRTLFRWIEALEIFTNKNIYIPAQLVYYNYKFNKEEGKLAIPISTGATGGINFNDALIRGILECIERDAFMTSYLNKTCRKKINLKSLKDPRILKVLEIAKRYRIQVNLFDITTDLNIPTYLSILIDKSGLAPAVLVGAKSDFNDYDAILGALNESFSVQCWFRELHISKDANYKINPDEIVSTDDRGLFWYDKTNINKLDFWLNLKLEDISVSTTTKEMTNNNKLKLLKKLLRTNKFDIYVANIGIPELAKANYTVLKVVIPQLQPMYLDERYKYLGTKRIYDLPIKLGFKPKSEKELNIFPHPFL